MWQMLEINPEVNEDDKGAEPVHLLWSLFFLKMCQTEPVLTGMCGGMREDALKMVLVLFASSVSCLEHDVVSCFLVVTALTLCTNILLHLPSSQIIGENHKIGDKG